MARRQLTGNAKTDDAIGIVGLVPRMRHHERRPACPHRQASRADAAVMHDRRRARKELREGGIVDGQHAVGQIRRPVQFPDVRMELRRLVFPNHKTLVAERRPHNTVDHVSHDTMLVRSGKYAPRRLVLLEQQSCSSVATAAQATNRLDLRQRLERRPVELATGRSVADAQPDHFWRRPMQKCKMSEVGVL